MFRARVSRGLRRMKNRAVVLPLFFAGLGGGLPTFRFRWHILIASRPLETLPAGGIVDADHSFEGNRDSLSVLFSPSLSVPRLAVASRERAHLTRRSSHQLTANSFSASPTLFIISWNSASRSSSHLVSSFSTSSMMPSTTSSTRDSRARGRDDTLDTSARCNRCTLSPSNAGEDALQAVNNESMQNQASAWSPDAEALLTSAANARRNCVALSLSSAEFYARKYSGGGQISGRALLPR